MRSVYCLLTGICLAAAGGCHDNTPPPARTPVPAAGNPEAYRQVDAPRPLDPGALPPPSDPRPYADEPLVVQPPPEQRAFVEAYGRVGRPRLVLFVNRTLTGDVMPVTGTPDRYEKTVNSDAGGVKNSSEKIEVHSRPPGTDDVGAAQIDYSAVENIMSDWLAANGQTTLISADLARQKLTDDQVRELQSGKPAVLSQLVQQLDADVLIQVQAKPTKQTAQGTEVRLVAEALNIRGGQSIGRAVVDCPPPLQKIQINAYTRFLARKLMDDMTGSWTTMAMQPPPAPAAPPPPAPPAPTNAVPAVPPPAATAPAH